MLFDDRVDAGKKLAAKLKEFATRKDVIVLGLARGGVVVAAEVAKALHLPLDVVVVRKVGAPDNEELALGAVSDMGSGIFNEHLISLLGVSKEYVKKQTQRQRELVDARQRHYLKGRSAPCLQGKMAILVDDGIATGASMKVAINSIKAKGVSKIALAIPVASAESLDEISKLVDQVICLSVPRVFQAVGAFYRRFEQVSDDEVSALLIGRLEEKG